MICHVIDVFIWSFFIPRGVKCIALKIDKLPINSRHVTECFRADVYYEVKRYFSLNARVKEIDGHGHGYVD